MAAIDRCRHALHITQAALVAPAERREGAGGLAFVATARLLGALGGLMATGHAHAAELPEDRADLMLHSFDGGGVEAWGPALLVRKNLLNKVSLFGTYYADIVSNASIDVVTTDSPYRVTRHEYGLGADYGDHRKSLPLPHFAQQFSLVLVIDLMIGHRLAGGDERQPKPNAWILGLIGR